MRRKKNDVYTILLAKLNEYFSPRRNSTFERHLFHELKPMEGEDFNKFLMRVRQQAEKCTFGKTESEAKEINIKDALIEKWATVDLKKRLLEKEMSLEEVINSCKVFEQINNQTATSSSVPSGYMNVNRVVNKFRNSDISCSRCGFNNHLADDPKCPAKNEKCKKCNMIGHFARKCKTRIKRQWPSDRSDKPSKRQRGSMSRVQCIEDDVSEEDTQNGKFNCFRVEDESDQEMNVTVD